MRIIFIAAAAALAFGTDAFAQHNGPDEAAFFAKKVAGSNAFEIRSSQLAKEQGQSEEVKSFADQMIAHHTKLGDEFKAALKEANFSPPPVEEPDAEQNVTLSRLRSAQGAAFDKAYVSAQLEAHKEAVIIFRSYAMRGETAALKDFARKTIPTLEHHLSVVQALSKFGAVAGKRLTGTGGAALGPPVDLASPGGAKQ
jgi:putative membrane protein